MLIAASRATHAEHRRPAGTLRYIQIRIRVLLIAIALAIDVTYAQEHAMAPWRLQQRCSQAHVVTGSHQATVPRWSDMHVHVYTYDAYAYAWHPSHALTRMEERVMHHAHPSSSTLNARARQVHGQRCAPRRSSCG